MSRFHRLLVILVAGGLFAACGSGDSTPGTDAVADPGQEVVADAPIDPGGEVKTDVPGEVPGDPGADVPALKASLTVTVLSAPGTALAGATVEAGGTTLATDATGIARFADLAPGRIVAKVTAAGYAPSTAVAEVQTGLDVKASVRMLSLGTPVKVKAEDGGVAVKGGVRVVFPPGVLVDSQGNAVTGDVDVTLAGIDPTSGAVDAAPGPFQGLPAGGGDPVMLRSLFLAEISLSQGGQAVRLAVGRKALLEFALPLALQDRYQEGDRIPAWWYDLDAGRWHQEGEGVVRVPAPGLPKTWAVEVGHFTWWNADLAVDGLNCVKVTVTRSDGGGAVAGLQVRAAGDFGWAGGLTDAGGVACIDFPRGANARAALDPGNGEWLGDVPVEGWANGASCAGGGDPCREVALALVACEDAAACDDQDPCTTDACDEQPLGFKACTHAWKCDDGNECTTDSCNSEGACLHEDPCDDGNPCTLTSCFAGQCVWAPVLDSACNPAVGCDDAADCEDGQPCSVTDCVDHACVVASMADPCGDPCTDDGDCDTGLKCALGYCAFGIGCYVYEDACDDGNECTTDACNETNGCTHAEIPACQCTPKDHKACCGADVCWADSCGVMGEVAEDCTGAAACEDGLLGPACKACAPVCPADWCGDDGCGGTCACTGSKVCNPATDTCEAPCVKDCGARECGPDPVCGESCGTCSGEKPDCNVETGMCQAGCTPQHHKECCDASPINPAPGAPMPAALPLKTAICWFDSCGVKDPGDPVQSCTGGDPGNPQVCLPKDPPECGTCTYNCGGLVGYRCGVDDGCFGICECPANYKCNDATDLCIACSCSGKACGADDGCGNPCVGTCPAGQVCVAATHTCCAPTCTGVACGADDGCGGKCNGTCPAGQVCNTTLHACETFKTECAKFADCAVPCGQNTSCLMACYQQYPGGATKAQALGTCVQGQCGTAPTTECYATAIAGACKTQYDDCFVCTPNCSGKTCGDDGCAGSCGTCGGGATCYNGNCCTPSSCAGKQCGDAGCGVSCGTCPDGQTCLANGTCSSACTPQASVGCCNGVPDGRAAAAGPSTGNSICWYDSCGVQGTVIQACLELGCQVIETVLTCQNCKCGTVKPCGASGCGFSCGTCSETEACNPNGAGTGIGMCQPPA